MNTIKEQYLTRNDEVLLRQLINRSISASFYVFAALFVISLGILGYMYWKDALSFGLNMRTVALAVAPFLCLIGLQLQHVQVWSDLRNGKKRVYVLKDYSLQTMDDALYLVSKEVGLKKIPLHESFQKRIKKDQSLHIEITPKAQQLLWLSQDENNWLEDPIV